MTECMRVLIVVFSVVISVIATLGWFRWRGGVDA